MNIKQHIYLIGIWTIVSCALAILSDLIELAIHGFSYIQILITYIAFLGIPFGIIGLYAIHYKKGGITLLIGAVCFGLSYIFFTGTVVYVLAENTQHYLELTQKLGIIYDLHGVLMIIGGILIGIAILKDKLAYIWAGVLIILGSVISLVGALLPFRDISYMFGNAFRYIGFIGFASYTLLKQKQAEY